MKSQEGVNTEINLVLPCPVPVQEDTDPRQIIQQECMVSTTMGLIITLIPLQLTEQVCTQAPTLTTLDCPCLDQDLEAY